jgi:hypothetical protein
MEFSSKAFVSTSLVEDAAHEFARDPKLRHELVSHVTVPAGARGMYMPGGKQTEDESQGELLLPPGTRFVVEKVTTSGNRTTVHMRVVV